MSGTKTINEQSLQTAVAVNIELKLEVVIIPVSDVDRAKRFYQSLGWRPDADFAFDNGFRVVQFTPPGWGVRSNSAPTSRRPRPAQPRTFTSSCRTSRPHKGPRRQGCHGDRGVPSHDARSSVQARRHEGAREGSGSRAHQLQLVRNV